MSNSPLDAFLLSAQVMIENATTDPKVQTALALYGYTPEKLAIGKKLYDEASALFIAQQKEYGEQVAATTELNEIWEKAHTQYMKTLKIARVALKDNAKAERAMLLFGDRNQSLSGWLKQAKIFYTNIIGDGTLTQALNEYGYNRAKLSEEKNLLDEVEAKNAAQQKETGEAQAATQDRDKKVDELAKYISDLRAVAKVALADDPQQLEKLGILARTSKAVSKSKSQVESGQTTQSKTN